MGTRRHTPQFGAVDRIYGILRERPYERMSIRAIGRAAGPSMSYHTVVGNAAHCRNRFHPYVRRVAPGVYMYTPGGALDNARYPERSARSTVPKDPRTPMGKENDLRRAEADARLTMEALLGRKNDPVKVEEPVPNHITTVTYKVLGELKDGGVLLVDSDGDIWEIKRLVEKSAR